jgi:hypothetical protein
MCLPCQMENYRQAVALDRCSLAGAGEKSRVTVTTHCVIAPCPVRKGKQRRRVPPVGTLSRLGQNSRAGILRLRLTGHATSATSRRACETRAAAARATQATGRKSGDGGKGGPFPPGARLRDASPRKECKKKVAFLPLPRTEALWIPAYARSAGVAGGRKHGMASPQRALGRPLLRCDVRALPGRDRTLHGWSGLRGAVRALHYRLAIYPICEIMISRG